MIQAGGPARTLMAPAVVAVVMLGAASAQAQTAQSPGPVAAGVAHDPWEGTNRGLYKFSMGVDRAVFAPIIHGYKRVVPGFARQALSNAVDNLDEPGIAANDILQGHPKRAGTSVTRFVVNSTIGLGGMIDFAGKSGLHRHESDFGQTLGRYGVRPGPYIFVPFVGPNNLRDGFGKIVDAVGDPVGAVGGGLDTTFGQVYDGVYVFQARVDVDDQLTILEQDTTDPYATLRSAYAQNRAAMVAQARGESPAATVKALPDFGAEPAPATLPSH
jgi:phospholipid-binding lipoprotein MlaA